MDSLPARDFAKLFERMTAYIDLKGCETPEDVERKMLSAIKLMRRARDRAKKPSTVKKWSGRLKHIYILGRDGVPAKTLEKTRMGFAVRTLEETMVHPRRRIALTLKYGKEEARRILRKRLLKRLRTIAKRKA